LSIFFLMKKRLISIWALLQAHRAIFVPNAFKTITSCIQAPVSGNLHDVVLLSINCLVYDVIILGKARYQKLSAGSQSLNASLKSSQDVCNHGGSHAADTLNACNSRIHNLIIASPASELLDGFDSLIDAGRTRWITTAFQSIVEIGSCPAALIAAP
jgi:hypothetical protein